MARLPNKLPSLIAMAFACHFVASETTDFSPLQCNKDAAIDSDECVSNSVKFSELFLEDKETTLTIPCGQCVIMDYTDGSTITIEGGLNVVGRLHFPSSANVNLRTTAVFVQGIWSMDTPDEGNTVKLSLFGKVEQYISPHDPCCSNIDDVYGYDCSCSEPQIIGFKPFAVIGGQLNIRAIDESCSSWTKLKEMNTDTMQSIKVDAKFSNCLRQGDELLVTSDGRSYNSHSILHVDSVDKETGDVVLEQQMERVFPSEAGPGEAMFAVEIALLRRDVIFEAEVNPEVDPGVDPNGHLIGGHSIIFHTPTVVQTIQGVKFENFGQQGIIGRYPIHFHKSGLSPSLVSKNVITRSNHRCVFIHDTDGVTIDDNVAFDNSGHCYATETGNERNNVFSNNLGAFTKKLQLANGDSDSPEGHSTGTAIFWIRNMENTFVGNVAAGSASSGFWLEMKDKYSNQLNEHSFKDNVAHSSFQGLLTYKKGWKPMEPAVIENFKTYKNDEGCKFHITGNLKMKNSIIADNRFGIRYGVWNSGVTIEDTTIVGLSSDAKLRQGKTCPASHACGIRASFNSAPGTYGQVALKNVVFSDFLCGSRSLAIYEDSRLENDMGDPIQATSVTVINSDEQNKPKLDACGSAYQNWFMEDFDGTLGPEGKGKGFLVRDNQRTTVFLPEEKCEPMPYGQPGCAAFCEDVCLRLVHIQPTGRYNKENTDFYWLQLTEANSGIAQRYRLNEYARAIVTLPPGTYTGEFFDENDTPLMVDTVEVEAWREPRCENFVSETDFSFPNTAPPTPSPSQNPTVFYEKEYVAVGSNLKCPSDGRVFKHLQTPSLEECHGRCFAFPGCNYFSYRLSEQTCIACVLGDESQLAYQARYDAYRMETVKDPATEFGYELWTNADSSKTGFNRKCPFRNSDRISKSRVSSRKECYELCKDTTECGWFTFGEEHGHTKYKGLCMLCRADGGFSTAGGFNTYTVLDLTIRV